MVERVSRHRDKTPLFEATGVDDAIRSTLSRRVELPSGGSLVFDYAEAFTVIDVNTGRFVGSRSKTSGARLEDTITANNLEAVKEVVHQLRLRDIGGIIVIDFIDMANPKNRATVEEALKQELERDRTKTYVVEISPLGLVEMTRQNVTEGPREILTQKCPTCAGDGIVLSAESAAVEIERKLRGLAVNSKRGVEAYRVELEQHVGEHVIGPGAARLAEIEARSKRRFFIDGKTGVALEHFKVVAEGKLADLAPTGPVAEGEEVRVELVEVGRHDLLAAVAKLDGYALVVSDAAKLVGKKAKVRVDRVLDGVAYASLVTPAKAGAGDGPITAESEAEKPTRAPRRKKPESDEPVPKATAEAAPKPEVEPEPKAEAEAVAEPEEAAATAAPAADGPAEEKPKKKTRRGTRGGRNRRRKPAGATATAAAANGEGEPEVAAVATIHVPDETLGRDNGGEAATPTPRPRPTASNRPRRRRHGAGRAAAVTGARSLRPRPGRRRRRRPRVRTSLPAGPGFAGLSADRYTASSAGVARDFYGRLRDHLTGRQAIPRPGGRPVARGPAQAGRGQDVPARDPLPRRRGQGRLQPQGDHGDGSGRGTTLGQKIKIGKYRKRTGYRRHTGHRSRLSEIEIEAIGGKSSTAAKPKAEEKKAEAPKRAKATTTTKKPAAKKAPAKKES